MKLTLEMNLSQEAKKQGGDRYSGYTEFNDEITIYLPQRYSREKSRIPLKQFMMELKDELE